MSDTHLPKRAGAARPAARRDRRRATSSSTRGTGSTTARSTCWRAAAAGCSPCYGNNDGPELRARLPEVARAELGGLRFGVVHETGAGPGREARCAARFPDLDVLVFGHSHIPWDTTAPGGLRLLNPGSPTDRRRQPYCTYLTATAAGGRLTDVVLHRLPPR